MKYVNVDGLGAVAEKCKVLEVYAETNRIRFVDADGKEHNVKGRKGAKGYLNFTFHDFTYYIKTTEETFVHIEGRLINCENPKEKYDLYSIPDCFLKFN